ncbi:MAG: ABC transporter permease [Bacteroidales bacterium]|nr:ABC transporter permease [Bacteroidales bacterium]
MKSNSFQTARFIGLRYLFSPKKHHAINVISIISMLGIMVSSAALIIVLSVFNGMEGLVRSSFNSFNPDYQILPKEGKVFSTDTFPMAKLQKLEGIQAVYEVVADMTLMTYNEKQLLVSVKGVRPDYLHATGIDALLIDGNATLQYDEGPAAVMGAVAAGNIQLNLHSPEQLKVYYPKRLLKNLADPTKAFNIDYVIPAGVFASYTEYDEKYVFVPLDFARSIMNYEKEVTSAELKLESPKEYAKIRASIENVLGENYILKDKYQQEESLYKTMKSEKLMVFVILAFILVVAGFNMIGTLSMLIIEKKDDLSVLYAMGARKSLVRKIFMVQGGFISLLGGLAGLLIGLLICFLQMKFHIVGLGDGSAGYLINYYPVQIEWLDFVLVIFTILIISIITSYIPIRYMKNLVVDKK